MTVLVAGGAGFIGSHLCDALLAQNKNVICVDNFLTGNRSNLQKALDNKNFSLLEQDITNKFDIDKKIDVLFNLASPASPVDYMDLPLQTMKVGSIGTLNTLELAKKHDAIYIFASTSEIYGDPLVSPQHEDYWGNVNPIGPRSVYDESKRFSEALVSLYSRRYKVNTKIIRLFNTYGPRMKPQDGRVIPNFLSQALKGLPLSVYGDGSQTRSFCYIDDIISALLGLIDSNEKGPVNLGNPNEFTIKELADIINKMFKNPLSNVKYKDLPQDDPKQRRPDISKANKMLGWEPKVSLEEGLKLTLDHFKSI